MRTILTVPDLQVPYHHKRAVSALSRFVRAWQPDSVQCVGDEIDLPQLSRWTDGTRGEYAGKVHKDRDKTARVLEQLGVQHVMRSNHGARMFDYLSRKAPALLDEPELQYERYMRFDDLGITYHRRMWEFAPGWLLAHGDEGGLSSIAGTTAARLAKATGKSVTCGHTHRAGIQPFTEAYGGKATRTLYGHEVGCLMDMGKAGYLKSGGANWQLSFGIHFVDGTKVSPHIVYMRPDGSFVWEKKEWKP
jgi:hypothetical protein